MPQYGISPSLLRGLSPSRSWRAAAILLLSGVAACGGNDSPTQPGPGDPADISGDIIYSRNRDGAGNIAPVLSESGGGFDSIEVDSPAVAVDSGRPGGDKFLVYYEADGPQATTIGLVTSSEEDLIPLGLGRTQVVPLGPGGGPYDFASTDPSVIVDKRTGEETRRYKMWFEGRSGVRGQTSTIMFGASDDGLTWPTFVPCTGLSPSFGQVRVADPTVLFDGLKYRMWFEAIASSVGGIDGAAVIGYAESNDGIAWVIKDAAGNTAAAAGPVFLPAGGSGFDSYSVGSPSVVMDIADAVAPWKMWYEAGDQAGDVQNTFGYATSPDGSSWSRATKPIIRPSSDTRVPLPFDSGDLEHPCAVIDASVPAELKGHFLLWYTGDAEGSATPNRIGFAAGMAGP